MPREQSHGGDEKHQRADDGAHAADALHRFAERRTQCFHRRDATGAQCGHQARNERHTDTQDNRNDKQRRIDDSRHFDIHELFDEWIHRPNDANAQQIAQSDADRRADDALDQSFGEHQTA